MSRVIAEGKIYETKLNTAKDGRGPGLQLPNRLQLKRWFGDWQNNPKKALRKYQKMSYHPSVLRLMTSLLLCLLKKNSSYNDRTANTNVSGSPSITTVSANNISQDVKHVKYLIFEETELIQELDSEEVADLKDAISFLRLRGELQSHHNFF